MRSLLVLALLASTAPSLAHADDGDTVLLPHRAPPVQVPAPAGAKQQAIVASVVAGGFIFAAGFSYMWAQHEAAPLEQLALETTTANDQTRAAASAADRWHTYSYWLAAGSLVSVSIAGYLWTRTQPRWVPAVEASPHGGSVGFATKF
jgi:hypothetical protein